MAMMKCTRIPKWLPHSVPVETADKIIREKLKTTYDVILIGRKYHGQSCRTTCAWIEEH